jgi:hypothetical protein
LGRNKNHINSFIVNLKAEMGRKRRQMSKIFGYKEGHTPSHKGKNLGRNNIGGQGDWLTSITVRIPSLSCVTLDSKTSCFILIKGSELEIMK